MEIPAVSVPSDKPAHTRLARLISGSAALLLGLGAAMGGAPALAQAKGPAPPAEATSEPAATGRPTPVKAPSSPATPLPPGGIARINGQDITRNQFLQELYDFLGESYREAFVSHVLIDQKAKALGVEATQGEIDARVQEGIDRVLKDNFAGDTKRMDDALKDRGMTLAGWKKRLAIDARYDILLDKLIWRDRIVTDDALNRIFEARYGPGGVQVKIRHILKNVPVAASQDYSLQKFNQEKDAIDQEAKARAEEALKKLNSGESFEIVMAAYSDDPRKAMGGVMSGWKGRYGPGLDEAVSKLQKGQRSGVVTCPDGYRVVECMDISQDEQIHAEHILIATGARGKGRTDEEAKKKADELLVRLKAGEDFSQLAKDNSDDTASAARGGDLGWFGRRVMVKPFEDAAFSMAPGTISTPPVQTTFGYHIIKVIERRTNEERVVRQILVGTQFAMVKDRRLRPALEAKALGELGGVLNELAKGGAFADLAKTHSDDPATKADGGLIKNYREGLYGSDFDEAARSMKPADPPKTVTDAAGNLHLLIIDEVQKTDFGQVRDTIRDEEMQRPPTAQEKTAYLASLRESASIVW